MILNLARVDTLRVEDMLKRSYAEIDSAREMPDRAKQLEAVKLRLQSIIGQDDTHPPAVDKYYATCARLKSLAFDTQVHKCLCAVTVCSVHVPFCCYRGS